MADRTLTSFTEASLNGQFAVTIRIERSASGSGLFFITERPNGKDDGVEGDVVFVPNPHEFLAPVNAWLSSGTVPVPPRKVSETVIGRAIEIGEELIKVDKAILEGRIAYTNDDVTRSDYYKTGIFKVLSAHRETLREELLSINNTIKE